MQEPQTRSLDVLQLQTFSGRLGKIFSNISIFSMVVLWCAVLSAVSTVLLFLLGLSIIVISLGTVFAIIPNYWEILMDTANMSGKFGDFILRYWVVFLSLIFISCALSLVFLLLDRKAGHTARIVLSSLVLGMAVVCAIVIGAR